MSEDERSNLNHAVLKLLRPLVRLLIRHGVPFGVFADMARWVYVDAAEQDLGLPGRSPSKSRISVVTGLSRKEVLKQKKITQPEEGQSLVKYNRAARVISGWVRDRAYHDKNGDPLSLPLDAANQKTPSFSSLVKKYSGDIPVRALLDELLHVGAVRMSGAGTVDLLNRAYIPENSDTLKLNILGTDVSDLLNTINNNIMNPANPRFQRKVSYDNVPDDAVLRFKGLSEEQCQKLLEKMDGWLSANDRDVNPEIQGKGRNRVGIGIYYFVEDLDSENKNHGPGE